MAKKVNKTALEELGRRFFPHLTPSTRATLVSILFDIYGKAGIITVKPEKHEHKN
jgi:hypothetical protein